jgi:glucokinase
MNYQPKADAKYVVGVDLGGTNVRAAVIDREGDIISQVQNPSEARNGKERVVAQVAKTVEEAIAAAHLTAEHIGAVGMAVPGHIVPGSGLIIWSPNFGETVDGQFRMFLNVPFTEPVSEALKIATYAGNDANIAALGEFRYGSGRGVNDMVMFTLGTGIGSGVISHGRLIVGSTGGAVELGHQTIVAGGWRCGCGNFGCLEAYCGTTGIVERAMRVIETNRPTLLREKVEKDRTALTPLMIDEAARVGDTVACEVFQEIGYYLGIGIANAVMIFNPEIVVLGGGIRKATGLLNAAENSLRIHAVYSMHNTCQIVEATLGGDAGVKGAAVLAWQKVDGQE